MTPFKFQLTHFSSTTALRTKHKTLLKEKLDLVEVLLRLVFILNRTSFEFLNQTV